MSNAVMVNEISNDYKEKWYNTDQNLNQDDNSMLDEFAKYIGDTYICDAITEIADGNVGIYNSDICDNCWNLYSSGVYEEASEEGLMEGSNDLIKNLQSAWYQYNSQQLYNNLKEMIYNYAIQDIVFNEKYLSEDELLEMEVELENIDNNNRFEDIIEAVDKIIESREE